jgi:hypothetical protein
MRLSCAATSTIAQPSTASFRASSAAFPQKSSLVPWIARFNPSSGRGVTRDMSAKPEGMQLMIDLVREDSKVAQPFDAAQLVDYSFLGKARRDLNLPRQ